MYFENGQLSHILTKIQVKCVYFCSYYLFIIDNIKKITYNQKCQLYYFRNQISSYKY